MKIETYKAYNPNKRVKVSLQEKIGQCFKWTDHMFRFLDDIRPDITSKYILVLNGRLLDAVGEYRVAPPSFDTEETMQGLSHLGDHPDLQDLIIRFIYKHLDLPAGYEPGPEEIEVSSLNDARAGRRLSYHRVKALVDLLSREEGIPLYKEIVNRILAAERAESERLGKGEKQISTVENIENAVKAWTDYGLADFTYAVLDDHMVLYRFDNCLTHEALRDLNDPDIAYLASCYVGDAEEFNTGRRRHLRRTQTLHNGDFCDELYWDADFHTDPEQPSLEFTRKLGK
jgi:hypothetical protein